MKKVIILKIVLFVIGIACIALGSKMLCDSIGDAAVAAFIEESSSSVPSDNQNPNYIFEEDNVQVYVV